MASRALVAIIILGSLAVLTAPASAFEGKRKGFMIGAGLGPGISSFSQDFTLDGFTTSGSQSEFGIATDFRLGYGPTDQVVIFYNNRVNWFGITNANNQDVTIADGIGGVMVAYFFKPDTPSWYVLGGLGYSVWSTPFESNASNSYGFGLVGGGGYQFTKLLSAELSVSYGNPSESEGFAKLETTSVGFRATLNVAAY